MKVPRAPIIDALKYCDNRIVILLIAVTMFDFLILLLLCLNLG